MCQALMDHEAALDAAAGGGDGDVAVPATATELELYQKGVTHYEQVRAVACVGTAGVRWS